MLSSAPLEGVALAEVVELPEVDGVVGVVTVGWVTVGGVTVVVPVGGVPEGRVPVGGVVGGKVRGRRPTQLASKAKASNYVVSQVPENEIKCGL